jgi:hypothetical protein
VRARLYSDDLRGNLVTYCQRGRLKTMAFGGRAWTEAEESKFRALVLEGKTAYQIADELGRSLDAVGARAKKLGISLKQISVRPRAD